MEEPTKQPDIGLAELQDKVIALMEIARTKKKQKEEAVVAKKAAEEKQLKDSFADGEFVAEWILGKRNNFPPNPIKIAGFERNCGSIEDYIDFLKTSFQKLQNQFKERKKLIYDPKKEIRLVSNPGRCRVFPGSGTVINDCCGGVNQHHSRSCRNLQEFPLAADELEALRKVQNEELEKLTGEIAILIKVLHAHMEGFIDFILKSNPDTVSLLGAVKVAMISGVDTFHEFGGREKVLGRLKTTVIDKIEERLSTGVNLDKAGIEEIERILNEVREAIRIHSGLHTI